MNKKWKYKKMIAWQWESLRVIRHSNVNRIITDTSGTSMAKQQTYHGKQPYKFGGKEYDEMNGLNWSDFIARFYGGIIPTFPTQDPLAEKDYSVSPYAYCRNNPARYVDPTGKDIDIFYVSGYDQWGKEKYDSWVFNGMNQKEAPQNQYVQDFLKSYDYNHKNGGGENTYKLANSRDMTVKLQGSSTNRYESGTVFWSSQWASTTKEGYVCSPATNLEHEMDHALDAITDPVAHSARAKAYDKQYGTKEERRVITGSEAKTAQANGEYPKGYTRTDHLEYEYIKVNDPTKTTPVTATPPVQQQNSTSTLWERFKQWWEK